MNPTANQTIQALQSELEKATVEAYSAREKLTVAEERLKSLRQAIAGVQLGERAAQERQEALARDATQEQAAA